MTSPRKGASESNRIGIYYPSLAVGGVERMLLALARGFVERGRAVDFVLHSTSGALVTAVPSGVRLVSLSDRSRGGPPSAILRLSGRLASRARIPLIRSLPYVSRLARYLREERPRVLLAAMAPFNIAALQARRRAGSGTRVVVSERANVTNALRSEGMVLGAWVLRRSMRRHYPRADAIVAVSRGVADDLAAFARLPRSRIRVIFNPVVGPDLGRLAREPVDHPWLQPGQPPVVLGVGRLAPQKDFPTLIRAVAEVRRTRPVRLIILGDGPERPALEALAGTLGLTDAVALPGFAANPYALLARTAVFVLSSRYEGFPNVLVEALAVGTPVVATDCPSGPAEILDGGRYGRLVPVGQPHALAGEIVAALDGPNDGALGQARVAVFGVDRSVSDYLEQFAELG